MVKNIVRYLLIILILCGVFYVVNAVDNDTEDSYAGISDISFEPNYELYSTDMSYDGIEYTIVHSDYNTNDTRFNDCYYALLIDHTDGEIYVSKNAHQRMYPASMTKLVTAMVVCDKLNSGEISEDDVVTVENYYDLTYEDVLPCELKPGSKITVKDLIYGLLIESNNYYALILADYVAGSQSAFCALMNQKMLDIGATNTHFVNPHGLDDPEHYSTAFDMYLITLEADTYEYIRNIDTYETYAYTYTNADNYPVDDDIMASNLFYNDYVDLPANFTIRTWKTGTTSGAGNCLTMCLTKDGHEYYLVASHGESKPELYDMIIEMLCLIK